MSSPLHSIRGVVRRPAAGRPLCLACGRRVDPGDEQLRLRGGVVAHRACATYGKHRRSGETRLRKPPG